MQKYILRQMQQWTTVPLHSDRSASFLRSGTPLLWPERVHVGVGKATGSGVWVIRRMVPMVDSHVPSLPARNLSFAVPGGDLMEPTSRQVEHIP